jgi:cytochrome b
MIKANATLVWDLPLRLWHWAFALAIAGSLWTGLSGEISLIDLHQRFGYCLLGLLLFRLAWALWGGRYARYEHYRFSPAGIWAHLRGMGAATPHTAPGAAIALAFFVLVLFQVGTGLFATDDIFTEGPLTGYVDRAAARSLTWLHHRIFWLLLAAVAIHLAAHATYALRGDATPLAMFTGRKHVDVAPTAQRLVLGAVTAGAAAALVWAFLALV